MSNRTGGSRTNRGTGAVLIAASMALAGSSGTASAISSYSVLDLGPVISTGDSGKDINSVGVAVSTRSTAVYVWQNGVGTPVPNLYAGNGSLAINDLGHMAGSQNQRGFLYHDGVITDLGGSQSAAVSAWDLNSSDTVTGSTFLSHERAWSWQNGTYTNLPSPAPGGVYNPTDDSIAYAINESGTIVGAYNYGNPGGTALRWSGGVATVLPTLGGFNRAEAFALNNSGQSVGYSADQHLFTYQATIWNGTVPSSLGSLPGMPQTLPRSINDLGQVVGLASPSSALTPASAFIWDGGQMIDLNTLIPGDPGWHLKEAKSINNSGQIVGWGTLNGIAHSFLISPVPAPSAAIALAAGLCLLGHRRRR